MWPTSRQRALVDALIAESVFEQLFSDALDTWVPKMLDAVLPNSLTAADDEQLILPPDPDAIAGLSGEWAVAADGIVLGTLAVYAVSVAEYEGSVDDSTDDDDEDSDDDDKDRILPERVVAPVSAATGLSDKVIAAAVRRVRNDPALNARANTHMAQVREEISHVPDTTFNRATAAITKVRSEPVAPSGNLNALLRVTVTEAVGRDAPGWDHLMNDQARLAAASTQNAAVIDAAILNAEGDDLEQVWICTLDSRTRPTHWAADGQRVPLGGKFKVGREQLRYPADSAGSAANTRNCRCRVGILAVDEKLPGERDRHTERGPGDSTVKNRDGSQADEIARREGDGNVRARDDPDGIGRTASAAPSTATMDINNDSGDNMAEDDTLFRTFTNSVIALVGTPSSDGRILAAEIDMSYRTFPQPLMWTKQTGHGHESAYTVGVLESAEVKNGKVLASGYLLNSPEADEAAEQMAHGVTGPSVDLADTTWVMTDEKGNEISEEDWWDLPDDVQIFMTVTKAELIGTTLVATPAFGDTAIVLNSTREARNVALVASVTAPVRTVPIPTYPAAFFDDPQLSGPTLPTMTEDGRIFGHLACFNTCHTGILDHCEMVPRSIAQYAHFHTAPPVLLDSGQRTPVGRLTVGTGHVADPHMAARPAMEHYDNTGTCFALVRVGEDEHGVWFSGVASPGATDTQIQAGLAAPLSGDWRQIGGNLELVAALAVNTPGFPIPQGSTDRDGRAYALVAAMGPKPQPKRQGLGSKMIADAVQAGITEYRASEQRREAALKIAEQGKKRRRDAAMAIVDRVKG